MKRARPRQAIRRVWLYSLLLLLPALIFLAVFFYEGRIDVAPTILIGVCLLIYLAICASALVDGIIRPLQTLSNVVSSLREGDLLTISEPRTLFGLSREAASHRFIAGGIGITPILSMIRWCVRHSVPWHLHYCVRSRMCAAYLDELRAFGGKVHVHANDESAGGTPDIQTLIGDVKPGEHVYCCGPGGLMDAVSHHGQQSGIPRENLHFERFTASPVQVANRSERAFTVVLARLGMRCVVEPSESILECLERHGVCPPFSCREGLCRSCEVEVLSGEVEHRDYVLSEHEQTSSKSLMICVSRAKSDELVIDF